MGRILPFAFLIAAMISGCAYQPIVDAGQPGFDPQRYQLDLAQCRIYADQINAFEEAGGGALVGAGIGAALGAIAGSFAGQVGEGAAIGAAVGGASGLAGGAGRGVVRREDVVRRCLAGRGYMVLN